ncbi:MULTISPECIES: ACP S-malonyltransferase [Paenibacillus]|uniref:ACP S-malonyltransferase n=1 Tax=Paenibacillus TaxID=44249 RepID=UPI0011A210F6|nr:MULTISPECIES: ACP S-malonyltransferase [Paenibacillus]MBJ9987817.1 ACP S-malonyltransferase [Paenibacillus sp. S28]
MLAYVFPGQGAQKKGMGGALFDEFPEIVAEADQVLGYSIRELCLDDPDSKLNQTEYTQPALYTVNALHYYKKIKDTGIKPDYVAGHSLGEYNALLAAGAFEFAAGLRLVQMRGALMSRAAGGAMAAVIGLSEEQIREALLANQLERIDVANLNSPKQIVISGSKADVEHARPMFEGMKDVMMFVPLRTSGAFHSRYMQESSEEFEAFLSGYSFGRLTIPVVSNVYARPYRDADIRANLVKQITHSVKWTESIRYLWGRGVEQFEEMGPGRVLTDLITRIRTEAEPLIVDDNELQNGKEALDDKSSIDSLPTMPAIESAQDHTMDQVTERLACISAASLGSSQFKKDYGLKYAYCTGAMYRGIASKEMVVRMGKAGMMGFFGAGGLKMPQIEDAIHYIKERLDPDQAAYGLNLVHNPSEPWVEEQTVDLFLKHGITVVEAAAFMSITPALVKYRAKGLRRDAEGQVTASHRMIAKVSRPEVAELFLSPAPERIVGKLLEERKISPQEAEMLRKIPVADDICAEADSGGHTDGAVAYALMPAMIKLRDEMMDKFGYRKQVRIGAAGGIGTPEAAAAAFMLGADFIVTGSINQCTVEAGTSDAVKDLLQQANVQDTEYAPAGDMFEMGARVQVLKKGLFFPARANKLYDLYRQYNSIDEIDSKTKAQIQDKYFKQSFASIYEKLCVSYPQVVEKADQNPKYKMALIFRWYFSYTTRLAIQGDEENRVDYQIHCGPALGAFNQWVKGTSLERWQNRHVDQIAEKLMLETAELLNRRLALFAGTPAANEVQPSGLDHVPAGAAR